MNTDESELIAHICTGNQEDYAILVDRYKTPLYRHCFYIVHDEDVAEDMAQESFIQAYSHLKRYDANKASFKTWLFTIATRQCLQQLRRKTPLPLEEEDMVVSSFVSPEEEIERQEIRRAVSRLTPHHRTALQLYYWHGYTYQDIATYMQAPIGTVRAWIHRGKQQLKEILS